MNKKIIIRLIPIIIGIFIGIIASINNDFESIFFSFFNLDTVFIFIEIFIAYYTITIIHEFGHLIFGKINGYKTIMFKVSLMTWKRENGKYKFTLEKTRGYDGLCCMIPTENTYSKNTSLLYYLGGVIMNLLTALLLIGLLYTNLAMPFYIKELLWIIVLLSFVGVILNILPYLNKNNPTDGYIVFEIIKNSNKAQKIIQINQYMSYLIAGTRPREILELNTPLLVNQEVIMWDTYIILYKLYYAIDNNDLTEVKKLVTLLENNYNKIPTAVQLGFDYELCYCYIILGISEKAKYYYQKVKTQLERDHDVNAYRVRAYYEYYINKNIDKGLAYCENGLSVADLFSFKGIAIMEKDLLLNLKEVLSAKEQRQKI